jgi:hypothetical protein
VQALPWGDITRNGRRGGIVVEKVQACNCGEITGKKTLLNNKAHVGITTKFSDTGTFVDNNGLYLDNNYCPQCGQKYNDKEGVNT